MHMCMRAQDTSKLVPKQAIGPADMRARKTSSLPCQASPAKQAKRYSQKIDVQAGALRYRERWRKQSAEEREATANTQQQWLG